MQGTTGVFELHVFIEHDRNKILNLLQLFLRGVVKLKRHKKQFFILTTSDCLECERGCLS